MSRIAAVLPRTHRRVGLLHSLLATALTAGIPFIGVGLIVRMEGGQPSALLVGVVATGLAMAASTLGTAVWMRHPASDSVSFGELMLWCWLRRVHSTKALADGNRELEQSGVSSITPAARLGVLREMSRALDRKDPYTFGHSRRVERFANATGLALNLRSKEQDVLRVAAAIHDVGKIHVPDEILRKEGALTDEEYAAIKAHAAMGAEMVAHMGKSEITEAVRHHHERWDGRGYPDGIAGDAIPLSARIIGVVDAYDAMTSTRSYRSSLGRKRAIEILREESGAQFDARVVTAFLSTMRKPFALVLSLPATSLAPVVRRIAQWFGRAAGTQVATAASAAGLAIALSISGATPFGESPRVAVDGAGDDVSDQVLGTLIRAADAKPSGASMQRTNDSEVSERLSDRDRDRKRRKAGSRSGKGKGGSGRRDQGSPAVASSGSGSTAGAGSTSPITGTVATDPVDTAEESVQDAAPEEETETGTDATQEWDPEADTDPQPARGTDCDGDIEETKGGSVHCDG